ncbi:hypothetical protein AMTRI_Chr02g259950 [Amborella trichopoda]
MVQSHASMKPTTNHNTAQNNSNTITRPLLHCDYFHKDDHTKDQCFKHVGYPKQQNKLHAYNVGTTAVPSINQLTSIAAPQFESNQRRQLLQILQVGRSSHLANLPGNLCFSTFSSFSDTWIIDNGVTDHIVYFPSLFSSIEPSSPIDLVKLPNGNFASVLHIGTIILSEQITLHNVLCVTSFSYNLIFVQNLTSDLQCFLRPLYFVGPIIEEDDWSV